MEVNLMQILKVEGISKIYGTKKNSKQYTALRSISFEVKEGDFIGVMGSSGSGKTTLLNILGSIDKPTTGRLIMNGNDVATLNKKQLANHRMNNIGFIFQDYNLLETMTLKENIILPLALRGNQVNDMESKLVKLAKDLGIVEILDKYPYEVSGGEQQRAAACRALINNPKMILADEPTGNLDPETAKEIMGLLEDINRAGTTILMATHAKDIVDNMQKRVIAIEKGVIARDEERGKYGYEI